MRFEWDEQKSHTNIRKHGLNFANVWEIFEAPMLVALDTRQDYAEDRWVGIGSFRGRVVVVVFTEPNDDTIRIISMRKALKRERVQYEKVLRDRLG